MQKTIQVTQEVYNKLLEKKVEVIKKQGNSESFSDIIMGLLG